MVLYRWMVEVPTDWWTVEETSATSVGTLDLDCRAKLFERPEEGWSKRIVRATAPPKFRRADPYREYILKGTALAPPRDKS